MELRQLRAFTAVATEGHFGRAAARLNLTQPGLSLRIRALERELGVQLLERSAREVHLTAAGVLLLPHATSLLRIEDRALRELKDQADGISGRLRLSYLTHGALTFPGKVVAEFRLRYPTVYVETTTDHSGSNVQRLRAGEVDAAFIHPGFVDPAQLLESMAIRLLRRDRVVVAAPEGHRLARLEQIPATALRGEPLIMLPRSPFMRFSVKLERWLAHHMGEEPNVVAHEPPDQALEAVAGSTSLISFANGSQAASRPVPGIAYRPLAPPVFVDFGVASFRDDELPTLANFLRLIDEMPEGKPDPLPEGGEVLGGEETPASSPFETNRLHVAMSAGD